MYVFPYSDKRRHHYVQCHVCHGIGHGDSFDINGDSLPCSNCQGDGEHLFHEAEFRDQIAEIIATHRDDIADCAERILQLIKAMGLIERGSK